MPDREKIIKGLERCLICNTSVIASPEGKNAYRDCEYTVGLYCGKDKLLRDVLDLLKEQEARWISVPHKRARICSHCEADEPYKFADDDAEVYEYCPHCGAKMTEGR